MKKCMIILSLVAVFVLTDVSIRRCTDSMQRMAQQEREQEEEKGTSVFDKNLYDTIDLSRITVADTARILDSLCSARDYLCTSSTCCWNLAWEIAVRLVMDSLEMEKTNSALPKHMRYRASEREQFQKQIERFQHITYEYYEKLDSTDPWNMYYTNIDLLNKVIKPHTEELRQAYKVAVEIYGPDGGKEE